MSDLVSVWITCPTPDAAEALGRTLVEDRLAACANVLPGLVSLYRWEGALQRDAEAGLLLKTRAGLFAALEARVRERHGYQVPCVVAWPVVATSAPYADWVRQQTREP